MNRRVSVWKYVRVGKKWRYCKPCVGKNGKTKPNWLSLKAGKNITPRATSTSIGPNAQDAVNAADF